MNKITILEKAEITAYIEQLNVRARDIDNLAVIVRAKPMLCGYVHFSREGSVIIAADRGNIAYDADDIGSIELSDETVTINMEVGHAQCYVIIRLFRECTDPMSILMSDRRSK